MIDDKTTDSANDYVIRVLDSPAEVASNAWDALLLRQSQATPFMRHAYLDALHASGCATPDTGWTPKFFLLERQGSLAAASVLYLKTHSRGEYVFDWAWANAYARHGLDYYPKAICAVPFTPVPGSRLLARNQTERELLASRMLDWCRRHQLSGLHCLFASADDLSAFQKSGQLQRHTVQFHWHNSRPGYASFEEFLSRPDARQTQENPPGSAQGGRRERRAIAASLIALNTSCMAAERVAYGRYWGALERVDCLHFEVCYYQPLAWCIDHGYQRFEGGAQGEHKLARALLPVTTCSSHWLAHPQFMAAVERYLDAERDDIGRYVEELRQHNPLRAQA